MGDICNVYKLLHQNFHPDFRGAFLPNVAFDEALWHLVLGRSREVETLPTLEFSTMKRTLEGTKRKRLRVSGFRARMETVGGRRTLNRRRAKGRHRIAI